MAWAAAPPTPSSGYARADRREHTWPPRTTDSVLPVEPALRRAEPARTASFGFPLLNSAPRRARRHTVEFAHQWQLGAVIDAAELLVSELMTNALEASRYSLGRRGDVAAMVAPLELRLVVEHRRLRIEVRDHNPRPPVMDEPDLTRERGRGLLLVDAYAEVWGYHRLPAGGKVVWCVVTAFDHDEA